MVRKRRKMVAAFVAVVCALAGAAVATVVTLGHGGKPLATFTAGQASQISHLLSSGRLREQVPVVAVELRRELLHSGAPLLPNGSRVRVLPQTFHATSPETGVVDAVVSGPRPGRWRLLLIREQGRWLLLGTRELS